MKCVICIVAALCASGAQAWPVKGSPSSRAISINLSSVTGGEGAFINELKNCGSLSSTSGYAFPLILNADGYPTSTPTNTLTCNITALPTSDNAERTFGFSGTGKVNLQGPSSAATIVSDPGSCVTANSSGNLTFTGTDCVVRFTFASAPASLGVQFPNSGTYSNLSNVYMVRTSEKASFDSGEIFRPVSAGMLLGKLSDLGVNIIRFLDWNNIANQNNVSQWDFLGRVSSFSYAGTRWEPTVFGATPITGTDTYSGPATSGSTSSYVDGQVYQNIITNANTSTTPTLSVGGGSAVTIVNINGGTLGVGSIAANALGTFVYNAKLNKWLYQSGALQTRVPVQIVTALCNKLAVNCWYEFPQMFTRASMASYVQYVRDNLSASLTAYFEWSNEAFNPVATPNQYAQAVGTARSFPDSSGNFKNEFALNHRIAMGIVTDNWSPRSVSTLVRVMAWAPYEVPAGVVNLGRNLMLDASGNYCTGSGCTIVERYDIAGTCSATNTTSGRPVDCTDAYAFAPYYNGAQIRWCTGGCTSYAGDMTDAITAVNNYLTGTPSLMQAALDFVDCDVRGIPTAAYPNCGSRNGTLGPDTLKSFSQSGGTYDNYNTLAGTWGKYVINYEGGFQDSAPTAARLTTLGITTCAGGDNTACAAGFAALIDAYKADSRFAALVYDQFTQFRSYPNLRIPSWYNMGPTVSSSSASVWSLFVGSTITVTPFQSYTGVRNYARGN